MTAPTKYRKKPVVIEAMQMPCGPGRDNTMEEVGAVARWMVEKGYRSQDDTYEVDFNLGEDYYIHNGHLTPGYGINFLEIETLEGTMTARPGDFIIRGVQGEFYPCKSDIFAATYELDDVS